MQAAVSDSLSDDERVEGLGTAPVATFVDVLLSGLGLSRGGSGFVRVRKAEIILLEYINLLYLERYARGRASTMYGL